MGDYFCSWKRRLGVVTLLVACVLMTGWVRSYRFIDFVDIPSWNSDHQIISEKGCICWKWQGRDSDEDMHRVRRLKWWWNESHRIEDQHLHIIGFCFLNDRNVPSTNVSAPYWSFVLPLTLLSAYLLLSKPRATKTPENQP